MSNKIKCNALPRYKAVNFYIEKKKKRGNKYGDEGRNEGIKNE